MPISAEDRSPRTDLLALSDLSQRDRIQILLSEYAALRAEVVARTGFGFQIAAVAFALISWVFSTLLSERPWYFWIILAVIAACFAAAIFVNVRDLTRAANRLAQIEHEVNSRAGEHLLVWETLSGVLSRMNLIRSFFSMIKPLPRSRLPALDSSYLQEEAARLATTRQLHSK
jgi:hypothetical protein